MNSQGNTYIFLVHFPKYQFDGLRCDKIKCVFNGDADRVDANYDFGKNWKGINATIASQMSSEVKTGIIELVY